METPNSETKIAGTPELGSRNSTTIKAGKGSVYFASGMRGNSRRALLDVTNDSPIAGLAIDKGDSTETPTSNIKQSPPLESVQTPGTGEALLRYQVKSLLQRVDNHAPSLRTLSHLNGYLTSPSRLLAPTPANTPDSAFASVNHSSLSKRSDQTIGLYVDSGISSPEPESKMESSVNFSDTPHPEVIDAVELTKDLSPEKPITRALLFDSPEKYTGATISSPRSNDSQKLRNMEDDNVSEWSVQVNISSPDPEQADYARGENEMEDQDDEYSENVNNGNDEEDCEAIEDDECEELCRGLNKVSVNGNGRHLGGVPAFAGKHTRFVYNSDDELEGEEVFDELPSPSQVRLKGIPTSKGKHLRFSDEDDDSQNVSN